MRFKMGLGKPVNMNPVHTGVGLGLQSLNFEIETRAQPNPILLNPTPSFSWIKYWVEDH